MKKTYIIILALVGLLIFFGMARGQETNLSTDKTKTSGKKVVTIDGIDHVEETFYGESSDLTLDAMIANNGVNIDKEDRVNTFPDPSYGLGSMITVTRATPIKIIDSGDEIELHTWKTTVGEVLQEAQIEVGEQDKVSEDLSAQVKFNMEIEITRVSTGDYTEYETIDYKTVTKKDASLEKGTKKKEQSGKNGKRAKIYEITKENGIEIGRKLIKTEVVSEPQDEIILEGTKVVSYGSGTATWYDLISGMTAASNTLSYGTKVLVRASNGKEVTVTIVDHGIQSGAIIDLSADAFKQLATLGTGKISVTLEKP